jgi:hypothetical protein
MRGTKGTEEIGGRVNTASGVPLEDSRSRDQGSGVREQRSELHSSAVLRYTPVGYRGVGGINCLVTGY